ncbi:hypothetical protein ACF068_30985 [Streptomyces sp. NPDC016309]|uniref:hypothetical protein n=1 Tax=Streptomyces sp. NPDC016309 TaxID=3364965 RepID=UPI0036F8206A
MTATTALPDLADVAERARAVHAAWQADAEMQTVVDGCAKYSSDWDDFYGGPLVSSYSVARDAEHLLVDALRVMALKTAVYELSGDELLAELPVPVPVDVTCHALCAQFTALSRIQQRTGHLFVHSTVNEHAIATPWDTGDYTHQAYKAAFGPVNERYWIPAAEVERRRRFLDARYATIGITDRGMTSAIDYAASA